uniref:Uncharacterized protein n=1 Tax=Oryza punctata TaxID=4537 RepID=A0A0E0LC15_ORYPU
MPVSRGDAPWIRQSASRMPGNGCRGGEEHFPALPVRFDGQSRESKEKINIKKVRVVVEEEEEEEFQSFAGEHEEKENIPYADGSSDHDLDDVGDNDN